MYFCSATIESQLQPRDLRTDTETPAKPGHSALCRNTSVRRALAGRIPQLGLKQCGLDTTMFRVGRGRCAPALRPAQPSRQMSKLTRKYAATDALTHRVASQWQEVVRDPGATGIPLGRAYHGRPPHLAQHLHSLPANTASGRNAPQSLA